MALTNGFANLSLDTSTQAVKASVDAVNAKTPSLGQANMAGSSPVVIASNQSAIPVSGTFYLATQPISATALPLPTGAATEASLSALNAKVTAVNTGAVTISSALPAGANAIGSVTVSNLPATQAVSASNLPLPTGAATEATLAALQAVQEEIKNLNDTMLVVFSAMLEKMPRVTGNDQAAVSIEAGSVGISTNQTLATLTTLSNMNAMGTKFVSGDNMMTAGVGHIYDNVKVS